MSVDQYSPYLVSCPKKKRPIIANTDVTLHVAYVKNILVTHQGKLVAKKINIIQPGINKKQCLRNEMGIPLGQPNVRIQYPIQFLLLSFKNNKAKAKSIQDSKGTGHDYPEKIR